MKKAGGSLRRPFLSLPRWSRGGGLCRASAERAPLADCFVEGLGSRFPLLHGQERPSSVAVGKRNIDPVARPQKFDIGRPGVGEIIQRDHVEIVGDLRRHGDQRIATILLRLLHRDPLDAVDRPAFEAGRNRKDDLDQMAGGKRWIGIALKRQERGQATARYVDAALDHRLLSAILAGLLLEGP